MKNIWKRGLAAVAIVCGGNTLATTEAISAEPNEEPLPSLFDGFELNGIRNYFWKQEECSHEAALAIMNGAIFAGVWGVAITSQDHSATPEDRDDSRSVMLTILKYAKEERKNVENYNQDKLEEHHSECNRIIAETDGSIMSTIPELVLEFIHSIVKVRYDWMSYQQAEQPQVDFDRAAEERAMKNHGILASLSEDQWLGLINTAERAGTVNPAEIADERDKLTPQEMMKIINFKIERIFQCAKISDELQLRVRRCITSILPVPGVNAWLQLMRFIHEDVMENPMAV
jgi:hypothetical protein